MTYEQLQISGLPSSESTPPQLQSYRRDFRVSLTVLREKVLAIVTAVTCGERLQELSAKLDQSGSSVKILPVCFQEKINGISDEFLTTLPRWGIASAGDYGELLTWEHRTDGKEYLLWRTPMASDGEFSNRTEQSLSERWITQKKKHLTEQVAFTEKFLTPSASDGLRSELSNTALAKHWATYGAQTNLAEQIAYQEVFPTPTVYGNGNRKGSSKKAGDGLGTYVKTYPTPVASGKLSGGTASYNKLQDLKQSGQITEEEQRSMSAGNGGKLNPTWVEWLMGFPLGWTDLGV